jgi:hypothetical protein
LRGSIRLNAAIDAAQISYFRGALIFIRLNLSDGRKHRSHGVVHPYVGRPELTRNGFGCALHGIGVGNIGRKHQGFSALFFYLAPGRVEPFLPARYEADVRLSARELSHDGSADSGSRASDDHHLRLHDAHALNQEDARTTSWLRANVAD